MIHFTFFSIHLVSLPIGPLFKKNFTLLGANCLVSINHSESVKTARSAFVSCLAKPEKTGDVSWGHHRCHRGMMSEKRAQKFNTDDASQPRSLKPHVLICRFFCKCTSFWECTIFCVSSSIIALSFNRGVLIWFIISEKWSSHLVLENRDLNAHVQSVAWHKQLFFCYCAWVDHW